MKKLKLILKSRIFLIIIVFVLIFRLYFNNNSSILDKSIIDFNCTIVNISKNNILLDCNELVTSYMEDSSLNIGDKLKIKGLLEEYDNNSNYNLFNYKYYQNINNIFYKLNINSYKKIGISNNPILKIKRYIVNRIKSLKSYNYLNAFLLGDKSGIDIESLKNLGIIHLFSVSFMHINLIIKLFEKGINNSKKRFVITAIFLLFYYFLIKSISLLRCLIFLLIKKINKELDLKYNNIILIIISVLFILIIKPNALYNIGFYYSVILSSGVSLFYKKIKINNKIIKSLIISSFIFILSFPLNIYTNFEVNVLSIIYNLLFIPFVSLILFPLSLLTFVFPIIDNFYIIFINIFELLLNLFNNYRITFIFIKPSILVIFVYYFIILLIFKNYRFIYMFLFIIMIHYNYNYLFPSKYVLFLNVGQGDSTLIHINNKNILLDTGGSNYKDISESITIPVLKSLGIRKIDYLILSHGDFDHMGETINLVNNFKVDNVIFNCGEYNELEQELIKVLNKKKIPYYSCIKELNIDNNKLYYLQTKEYDNENDNSNVIYTKINNYKFIFMGDAGVDKEKDILEKYNISDVDVLKVGHHGSKTSSSKEFINEIKPKHSIISVGKNNRYGHPNKEVLENLKDSKIYRTDNDGSIMFKIKNNRLHIGTCSR